MNLSASGIYYGIYSVCDLPLGCYQVYSDECQTKKCFQIAERFSGIFVQYSYQGIVTIFFPVIQATIDQIMLLTTIAILYSTIPSIDSSLKHAMCKNKPIHKY